LEFCHLMLIIDLDFLHLHKFNIV